MPPNPVPDYGSTASLAFLREVRQGSLARVQDSLSRDPDLAKIPDEHGHTALHLLAERLDRIEPAKLAGLLVTAGADVDARCPRGDTPLRRAVNRHNASFAKALLALGADPNGPNADGEPVLNHAVGEADEATVNALLDAGADPTAMDRAGFAPIHLALYHDTPWCRPEVHRSLRRILDRLLAMGVSPVEPRIPKDNQGRLNDVPAFPETPLLLGARHGAVGTLRRLLDLGVLPDDLNEQAGLMDAALVMAVQRQAWNGLLPLLDHEVALAAPLARQEAWLAQVPTDHPAHPRLEQRVLRQQPMAAPAPGVPRARL